VKDVMMRTPASCRSDTNLGAAAEIMWNRDCGMLPILNPENKVIGVVTDRDLCIALGTRNRLAGEIAVWDVASGKVFSCNPEEDIHAALATMAKSKVRRLPVINAAGKLEGILSMDDVVLHSESKVSGKTPGLSYDDVVDTLKKLYRPELPEVARKKTAST
ncbi:MAG: CBS domain-containing protein, partial [Candidatus Acidiferrales bacterium]